MVEPDNPRLKIWRKRFAC